MMKRRRKKKKDKSTLTSTSFGSVLNISSFKNCEKLAIGFRCRLTFSCVLCLTFVLLCCFASQRVLSDRLEIKPCRLDADAASGSKVIAPIRPIACLGGSVEIDKSIVRLM